MSEDGIRVVVLLGIPSHKCSSCGVKGEWGPGPESPTEADLAHCPKCGSGPLVELADNERFYEKNPR